MQFIRDIYKAGRTIGRPVISYEFFTPKTEEGDRTLMGKTIPELFQVRPDYCSVTYGAGGSTRQKTLSMVDQLQRKYDVTTMAHLTCVGATRQQIKEIITQAADLKIQNLLALRGDPPDGSQEFKHLPDGFQYAYELVRLIRETGGFCVGVAGFPEGHIACKGNTDQDWEYLRDKINYGADFVVSQFFFDNKYFFKFRDALVEKGVTVPIIPGILPILSTRQVAKFTQLCGAHIPSHFQQKLDELGDNDQAVTQFGLEYASSQCEELIKGGVEGLHFYTLNKSHSTLSILANLGIKQGVLAS